MKTYRLDDKKTILDGRLGMGMSYASRLIPHIFVSNIHTKVVPANWWQIEKEEGDNLTISVIGDVVNQLRQYDHVIVPGFGEYFALEMTPADSQAWRLLLERFDSSKLEKYPDPDAPTIGDRIWNWVTWAFIIYIALSAIDGCLQGLFGH